MNRSPSYGLRALHTAHSHHHKGGQKLPAEGGQKVSVVDTAFLSWCYSGYADAKAKRVVLLGQLSEAVKVGLAPRLLMSQTQG